jgi:peptide deformylase
VRASQNTRMLVSAAPVLLLGDPRLRVRSNEVAGFDAPTFIAARASLAETLADFRRRHGFGRAISAPQIGVPQRFIAVNLGEGLFFVINPVVTFASAEKFTMWDDCMSFPDLLVRVERHRTISLRYQDEKGSERLWEGMELEAGELLQHEIDHIDGILAVDRALPGNSLVMKSVFEANRAAYRREVDYVIV